MSLSRRWLLTAATLVPAAFRPAGALARSPATQPLTREPVRPGAPPQDVWDVWPGRPPGGERVPAWSSPTPPPRPVLAGDLHGYARPVLAVWRPQHASGGSLLILPGGGYHFVSWDNEGTSIAQRLLPTGITVYVLAYRLPGDRLGWANEADAPLADAQRAMRLIRDDAATHGRDPADVGVLGFSAGGHLAGRLLTEFGRPAYAPIDAGDRHSARPAYAGLLYPVITLKPPYTHTGSRRALVGEGNGHEALANALSVETNIRPGICPTFVAQALDDDVVDPQNALIALAALRTAQVPCELHLFQEGKHGFGVTLPSSVPAAAWPELFLAWARRIGGFGGEVPLR